MTNSYKLGNGKLILGSDPFDVAAQVRGCSVEPKEDVKTVDAIPVLDNTEIPKEETAEYSFTLKGKMLQDLAAAGVVNWSWDNAGNEVPFIYVPHTPAARGVEGTLVPVPLAIGGDIENPRTRPESDFEWRIIGTPVFGVYGDGADDEDPVDDTVTEDV